MDRRFGQPTLKELEACHVPVDLSAGLPGRFREFAEPFGDLLGSDSERYYFHAVLEGLAADGKKNLESIAYAHAHDRQMYQVFVGQKEWDHQPMLNLLAKQVGEQIGDENAVIVFDPTSFPKKGTKSVGVARQWCGRLGKVESCQVAIGMSLASEKGHAVTNICLFMPEEWTIARMKAAGVPKKFRKHLTRHQQMLGMLVEQRELLPHGWVAGDDECGRVGWFRRALDDLGERYFLAVPCNTTIRDLETKIEYSGSGAPKKSPFISVEKWMKSQPESRWQHVVVRDGAKGPLEVDVMICRVQAKVDGCVNDRDERLVIIRFVNEGSVQHDYYLTNADDSITATEYARVSKLAHTIEEDFKQAKSEAGLADYQVRNWYGWHHHVTMSLVTSWCLTQETLFQKKDSGDDGSTGAKPAVVSLAS
jgi:SRSO17 transposase